MPAEHHVTSVRWLLVRGCGDHEECRNDPWLGARCFARREGIDPFEIIKWPFCNDPAHDHERLLHLSLPIGSFDDRLIQPGEELRFVSNTSIEMQPIRLVVPSSIGRYFRIKDFIVGNYTAFAAWCPVDATIFAEHAWPIALDLPFLRPGQDVILHVRNIGDEPRVFSAVLDGVTLESQIIQAARDVRSERVREALTRPITAARGEVERAAWSGRPTDPRDMICTHERRGPVINGRLWCNECRSEVEISAGPSGRRVWRRVNT